MAAAARYRWRQIHYSELLRTLAKRTEHIHTRLLRNMMDNHIEYLRNLSAEYEAIAEKLLTAPVDTAELMELAGSFVELSRCTPYVWAYCVAD